jgi:hypothetical protein
MLAERKVALRVNGLRVTKARVRRGGQWPELIITDPVLGEVSIDESFTLELLELLFPPAMRQRLPNSGWRKVSLRILIALLRCRMVVLAKPENAVLCIPDDKIGGA